MKFKVEITGDMEDENTSDIETLIEEALHAYGYTAYATYVEDS